MKPGDASWRADQAELGLIAERGRNRKADESALDNTKFVSLVALAEERATAKAEAAALARFQPIIDTLKEQLKAEKSEHKSTNEALLASRAAQAKAEVELAMKTTLYEMEERIEAEAERRKQDRAATDVLAQKVFAVENRPVPVQRTQSPWKFNISRNDLGQIKEVVATPHV